MVVTLSIGGGRQRPISKPMSFWLEQDVLEFIHINNIPMQLVMVTL